mmetsp:Transcript_105187/g.163981  ORF Transcript_105187/g.163981 Transcript_105187/m.163981 type:complete len:164 (-) Transcript_105187:60-551(-)
MAFLRTPIEDAGEDIKFCCADISIEVPTCITERSTSVSSELSTSAGTTQDDISDAGSPLGSEKFFNSSDTPTNRDSCIAIDISGRRRTYGETPLKESSLLARRRKMQEQECKIVMPNLDIDRTVLPAPTFKARATDSSADVPKQATWLQRLAVCAATICVNIL